MLAGGIWTTLITTVMGLVVAIPALMAYYYLMLKVKDSESKPLNIAIEL